MISFTIALSALILILGYILYGKFVERVFQPDNPSNSCSRQGGWSGLYRHADVESIYDTVLSYLCSSLASS